MKKSRVEVVFVKTSQDPTAGVLIRVRLPDVTGRILSQCDVSAGKKK